MTATRYAAGLALVSLIGAALAVPSARADVEMLIDLSGSAAMHMHRVEIPFDGGVATIRTTWPKSVTQWPSGVIVEMSGHGAAMALIGDVRDDIAWVNYGQWVGITRMHTSDAAPSVLFEAYTGGAHCCSVLFVMTPVNGMLKSIGFPSAEGELRAELPPDIDGDGIRDIVREGEHVCKKDDCSQRTAIYNIVDGRMIDVTADQKFESFLAGFLAGEQEDEE